MSTDLVWLREPRRKTLLTRVSGTRGEQDVLFEESVFYAPDPRYGHPSIGDRGHFQAEGHKIKITGTRFRRNRDGELELVHRIRGVLPESGAKAQLFLDWDRRWRTMTSHAAMHLFVAACAEHYADWREAPRVQGNGQVRATVAFPKAKARDAVEAALARVASWVEARVPIETPYLTREALEERSTPQHLALKDVAPGEPTLRVCRIGDAAVVPCDAPLPGNTRDVPPLQLAGFAYRGDAVRILLRPRSG